MLHKSEKAFIILKQYSYMLKIFDYGLTPHEIGGVTKRLCREIFAGVRNVQKNYKYAAHFKKGGKNSQQPVLYRRTVLKSYLQTNVAHWTTNNN